MKMSAIETTALPPGSTVKHYTVADCIGFDQQGCVYRADCDDTDAPVMLFEYLPAGLAVRGAQGVQALEGKAEALSRAKASYATRLRAAGLVGHRALPALQDIWEEDGTVYAVAAWAPGRSLLTELSTRHGQVDKRRLESWVRSMGDALSALHRHGLVHGNLSIGMIRVLDTGELMLPLVGDGIHCEDVPPWIAPEQHPLNPRPAALGPWTDIYQMSAVVHQVMTGQAPPTVMKRWEGAAPFERLADMVGRYPEGMLLATKRGLSMHVTARPQSAEQWLAAAGFPDRREHPRHEPEGTAGDDSVVVEAAPVAHTGPGRRQDSSPDVSDARPVHVPTSAVAETAPATNGGHQALPEPIEARLERAEYRPPRRTPLWVWLSAGVAILALIGILTQS